MDLVGLTFIQQCQKTELNNKWLAEYVTSMSETSYVQPNMYNYAIEV
jgi:hypothetical protein